MGNKKASMGCLFWLALVLLTIVIVLANLKTAEKIIKQTGFQEIISEFLEKKDKKDKNEPQPNREQENETGTPTTQPDTIVQTRDQTPKATPVIEATPAPEPTDITSPEEETTHKNLRKALIYFVKVDENGNILLKGFDRTVYYNDSPLRDTLLTLMKGPFSNEINMEYYTMIPEKTVIKNIYVRDSTAFIDFNEQFRFNPLGAEGLKAQLNQVIYTATEFQNVKSVQILIEGNKVDYLGPEGIYIGQPLSRTSLIVRE